MSIDILQDARVHALLLRIDHELARRRREAGCGKCGAKLHCGNFPRKPKGCPASVRELYTSRFSFDCSRCDTRATPVSVRFMDRRHYVGMVLALVCPRGPAHRSWLCEKLKVSARTIKRWRCWWHETFVATPLWRLKRADFAPSVDEAALPGAAIERFSGADEAERIVRFLNFLLPASMGVLPM
jgi:hypothetical protein